jgi:hypothetical protein
MKQLVSLLLGGTALCSYAASPAHDSATHYTNPWGSNNPQNRTASGFAPWIFDVGTPSPKKPFKIDAANSAFAIPMSGYSGAYVSFTGDGQLDSGQEYDTTLIFHAPGHSTTGTPTQGFQLIAQSPTIPPSSRYHDFGHQVLGLYLGQTSAKEYGFGLAIHNTLSDENPDQWIELPINFEPGMSMKLEFITGSAGAWQLKLHPNNGNAIVLTSSEYGPTWNTTTGVDAIQIFTSQAVDKGHPLEWTSMSVK